MEGEVQIQVHIEMSENNNDLKNRTLHVLHMYCRRPKVWHEYPVGHASRIENIVEHEKRVRDLFSTYENASDKICLRT